MSSTIGEQPRAYAGLGEVALATGAIAAARSLGPTITNVAGTPRPMVAAQAGVAGVIAGLAGEGVARGLDAATDLDRFQSHLVVAGVGLGTALVGATMKSNPAKLTGSIGRVLAVTGLAGAGLDYAHAKLDKDGDGHFFPKVPLGVELAIGGAVAAGVGIKFGPRVVNLLKNSKQLAGSAAHVDAAGAKLNELIPRSKLTAGPQLFLANRIEDGHGAKAIRMVVPHKLDAPELRTALGLPATGALTSDQLSSIGIRSLEQQGAYALDDAGRPMVDVFLEGSPTGTGGLNAAPVMLTEQLARTATLDAQFGSKPSIQSFGKVGDAIDQFVAMSTANRDRVALMPEGARPPRYGVATSLGGLNFSELLQRHGVGIVDELGLEKIITLGAPNKLSKLDPSTLPEGFHIRATFEEFAELAPDVKSKARFVELYHADDPVPLLSIDMLWRRPDWMPANRIWKPGISFLQHVSDVTTSISRGTGGSLHGTGGHEYRNMKALRAFAEVMNLRTPDGTAISAELVETAAKRAQDTSVAAAGRLRDSLLGRVDVTKPTPAPPVAA